MVMIVCLHSIPIFPCRECASIRYLVYNIPKFFATVFNCYDCGSIYITPQKFLFLPSTTISNS